MLYADTSAIIRAYMNDEPEQAALERLLLRAAEPVLTLEIARVEFGGAMVRAVRAGRVRRADELIRRFDRDCGESAGIALVPLDRDPMLRDAHRLSVAYGLRALDAMHVAAAITESRRWPGPGPLRFVTRDEDQAAAARTEGLAIA
jgi:predicted nucleic acid-binding protein